MGSDKKNTLKIVSATSMVLFSLFACFSGCWAWFTAQRTSNTSNDGFGVSSLSSVDILSAYAVRYDGNHGATAINLFEDSSIAMSEYDYIFTDRNVNTPLFFRLELAKFNKSNALTITIPCSGAYKVDGTNYVANNLSNVVCAKFLRGLKVGNDVVVDDKDLSVAADVKASYDGMLANANSASGTPFVVSSAKASNSITLSLPAATAFDEDFIIEEDGGEKAVVFIELDYYVTNTVNLIDEYIDSYNGAEHSLSFVSDIGTISLNN